MRIHEDGCESASREGDSGAPESESIIAFQNLDRIGTEVQLHFAVVIDDSADMPLKRAVVFIPQQTQLLRLVDLKMDVVRFCDKATIDKELLTIGDSDWRLGRRSKEQKRKSEASNHRLDFALRFVAESIEHTAGYAGA